MSWWKEHKCETKKELEAWIRTMTAVAPRTLEADEFEWIMPILGRHYQFEEKGGRTAVAVRVKWVDAPGQSPSRCFFLVQPDGSEQDISWRIAVSPSGSPSLRSSHRFVMRCEVTEQIDAWVREHIAHGKVCGYCGGDVDRSEVDHAPPKTFAVIASEFEQAHGLSDQWRDGEQVGVSYFIDRTYAQKWKDFHAEHARLRWAHKECNNKNNKVT